MMASPTERVINRDRAISSAAESDAVYALVCQRVESAICEAQQAYQNDTTLNRAAARKRHSSAPWLAYLPDDAARLLRTYRTLVHGGPQAVKARRDLVQQLTDTIEASGGPPPATDARGTSEPSPSAAANSPSGAYASGGSFSGEAA
jgi:hypothetical protein